ncbi:MAG TPA: hypothetical protein VN643_05425 [Pyrinomonadaceae bacterium]|nr:hypothetical protein [Pyrinomonadaceae bacterium]
MVRYIGKSRRGTGVSPVGRHIGKSSRGTGVSPVVRHIGKMPMPLVDSGLRCGYQVG